MLAEMVSPCQVVTSAPLPQITGHRPCRPDARRNVCLKNGVPNTGALSFPPPGEGNCRSRFLRNLVRGIEQGSVKVHRNQARMEFFHTALLY